VGRLAPALALLVVAASTAHAGGFHISILGARRTGMMANLGNPDDVTALFHNPAGLADLRGTQLHLSSGITVLQSQTRLKALDPERFPAINPAGCGEPGAAPCPWPIDAQGYYTANFKPDRYLGLIPYLGASHDLGQHTRRLRNVVVSLAAYAPGAYGAYLPADAPTAYYIIEGLFIVAAATAGVGWRINDTISVGASVSYCYMRLGYAQKFSSVDVFTPAGQPPDMMGKLAQAALGDLRMDYAGSDSGVGWGVGALITPRRWLSIGLAYSGWTSPTFSGGVSVRPLGTTSTTAEQFRDLAGAFGYKLPTSLRVEMPIPPALMGGVSFRPTPWLEIGLDYRLWLYTLYKTQHITPIYDPSDPHKEPLTEASLSKDKDYGNSWELALGVLLRPFRRHREVELMAGVGFDKSPVPDRTFSIDMPSMNQLLFTLGSRARLGRHWRVGVAYMLIGYLKRTVTDSITSPPTNGSIWAVGHIPTLEAEYLY
jgi:long-subunit fatty acid transport protein